MKRYSDSKYAYLVSKLTEQELFCLQYCSVCDVSGECNTQDKVADLLALYNQRERLGMFISVPEDEK
jgi:hypothetical protein